MPRGTCTVKDCNKPHQARGFCHQHYKRWQRYGDPEIMHSTKDTMIHQLGSEEAYKLYMQELANLSWKKRR